MVTDLEMIQSRVQRLGNEHAIHVASGMEGHVFRDGEQRVAKAWFHKSPDEIVALKSYYWSLHTLSLPFATPEILSIDFVDGTTVSIECELSGRSMGELVCEQDETARYFAVEALTAILRGLGTDEVPHPGSNLPILDIRPSEEAFQRGPSHVPCEVASKKVAQFGSQLRVSVPGFDLLFARTIEHLLALTVARTCAIHGDLVSPNILLDDRGCVTAVLDWGLLSMFGDPAFDASITAGIFNMYGPHGREIDENLLTHFQRELGYSKERMLLYRALYAIMSSNFYSPNGTDGHYAWCVATLKREDIRSVLSSTRIE
ncbi:MAG: phosphotransferase family protein [Thermomicrobiales bacterium]